MSRPTQAEWDAAFPHAAARAAGGRLWNAAIRAARVADDAANEADSLWGPERAEADARREKVARLAKAALVAAILGRAEGGP